MSHATDAVSSPGDGGEGVEGRSRIDARTRRTRSCLARRAWHARCSLRSCVDQGGFPVANRKTLAAAPALALGGLLLLSPSTADAHPVYHGHVHGSVVIGGFY